MEGPYGMPPQQVQFIHYQPTPDPRHNGMFTPPPHDHHHGYGPVHGYSHIQGPCYPAPVWHQPTPYGPRGHYMHQRVMTPNASPPSMAAPKIIVEPLPSNLAQLDTKFIVESRHSPSPPTPCLSACPSAVSSPPASSMYQTPVHGAGYFNFAIEPTKDESHMLSFVEQEWSETSPIHVFPHPGDAKLLPSTSFTSSCNSPSLSPASPASQTSPSAYPVAEFVNLRDLTSSTLESSIILSSVQQFPPLPTLSAEDEEHKFALGTAAFPITPEQDIADPFSCTSEHPSFESSFCSDFDSEDEFSFVNFDHVAQQSDKRQKVASSPYEEEDFLSVHSFGSFDEDDCTAHAGLPSPPASSFSQEDDCCHSAKRQRKMTRSMSGSDCDSEYHMAIMTGQGNVSSRSEGQTQAPSSAASQSQSRFQ